MLLVANKKAIIIELTKREEPHIPEGVDYAIVSDFNVIIFIKSDIVKPDLVLSSNVKALSCWKNCDHKDKHKEPDIREYLEKNVNEGRNSVK